MYVCVYVCMSVSEAIFQACEARSSFSNKIFYSKKNTSTSWAPKHFVYITREIKLSFYYPCVAEKKVLAVAGFQQVDTADFCKRDCKKRRLPKHFFKLSYTGNNLRVLFPFDVQWFMLWGRFVVLLRKQNGSLFVLKQFNYY